MGSDSCDMTDHRSTAEKPPLSTIYTMGTSTRSLREFMEMLDAHTILRVVDVRRYPTSRHEHFRKENLEPALRAKGLEYAFLGHDLGGYRKGGYEAYMDSAEFNRGIETLISGAREGKTALICAERFPWKCHRRYIGQALEKRGWRVVHLIERDRIWMDKRGRGEVRPGVP
jgi:uncharacterized protein (DUF488 family)